MTNPKSNIKNLIESIVASPDLKHTHRHTDITMYLPSNFVIDDQIVNEVRKKQNVHCDASHHHDNQSGPFGSSQYQALYSRRTRGWKLTEEKETLHWGCRNNQRTTVSLSRVTAAESRRKLKNISVNYGD